jgi:hypothetical protein
MTLSAPFDILNGFPGWSLTFEPLFRQEQSRQSNGVTRTKDFGSPLWQTSVTSKTNLTRPVLDYWRARLNRLWSGEETFYGYSLSRCWPIAYPRGSWLTGSSFDGTNAVLSEIETDNKSIKLTGLPAGFKISVGDFLQIGDSDLYQAQEAVTASGAGATGQFEVFPNLWPGTATGTAVSFKRPHCLMTIVPGSVSTTAQPNGLGQVSFQAIEYRN